MAPDRRPDSKVAALAKALWRVGPWLRSSPRGRTATSSSSTDTKVRHVVARKCDLDEEETRNWPMAKTLDLRSFIGTHTRRNSN